MLEKYFRRKNHTDYITLQLPEVNREWWMSQFTVTDVRFDNI